MNPLEGLELEMGQGKRQLLLKTIRLVIAN